FVAHPGTGHLNPLLSIAARLRDAGHEAVFASFGPGANLAGIEAAGFALERFRPPLSALGFLVLPRLSGMLESVFAIALFQAQPVAYARRLMPIMARRRTALVVADCTF